MLWQADSCIDSQHCGACVSQIVSDIYDEIVRITFENASHSSSDHCLFQFGPDTDFSEVVRRSTDTLVMFAIVYLTSLSGFAKLAWKEIWNFLIPEQNLGALLSVFWFSKPF